MGHSKYEASWDLPCRAKSNYFSLILPNASTVSSYIFRVMATRAEWISSSGVSRSASSRTACICRMVYGVKTFGPMALNPLTPWSPYDAQPFHACIDCSMAMK